MMHYFLPRLLTLPLEWHHEASRVLRIELPKILTQGSSPGGPPPPWLCQEHSGDHEVRHAHQPEEDGDRSESEYWPSPTAIFY